MSDDLFSFFARQDRDEALRKVEDAGGPSIMVRALAMINDLPPGEMTGEDIRFKLIAQGIRPHHHNWWGAMINQAAKHELLEDTGEHRQMKGPKSHARSTRVYRITGKNRKQ